MKFLSTFLLIVCFLPIRAQSDGAILNRKISIHADHEKVVDVLNRIAREGNFSFSYNSTIIPQDQIITIDADRKTVREVLNEIFKGGMEYREKSSHLILSKVVLKTSQTTAFIVSGYVEDAVTKERLPNVSVFDKKSITSVITDEDGYFRMKLERKDQAVSISVEKENYRDTLVSITSPGNQYLTISIMPLRVDSVSVEEEAPLVDSVRREEPPMPYQDEPNVRNISDTIYNDVQLSVVPFFGTNGRLSGNIINNYSINVFGGYSLGTRQIELGVFVNMDRGDVSWLQVAGIGNLVGRNVYGIQASGFVNINGGETLAVQLTGLTNINFLDYKGVQVGGLTNINLQSADGVRIAGLMNYAKASSHGVQIAGLSNIQGGHYSGSQIAGGINISSGSVSGSQIAGLFNYGHEIHGTQIGLINVSDSLGGVPIGLLSFVKHGYYKIELSADEVFYSNLAFRTGVRQFYNIILAGIKPEQNINTKPVWNFGYGIGTAPRLTRWLDLNIDLTAQHINNGNFTSELSLLSKLHVGFDFRFMRKLSVYTGVTLNGYFTNPNYTDYPVLFTDYNPSIIYDHTFSDSNNLKMWWGFKAGIRFL